MKNFRTLLRCALVLAFVACGALSMPHGGAAPLQGDASRSMALPLIVRPAPPTPAPGSWRFVAIGDTRTSGFDPPDVTGTIVQLASAAEPRITLANGDLIYAMDSQTNVREQWARWRATLAPLGNYSDASPWLLASPGNHDVQGHAWATDLFEEAFSELPTNGPPGFEHRAYSLDYGGVRFISLDSERYDAAHRLGDEQLAWLEQQLRNNPNRYTIVWSHDPAFPVGPHVGSSLDAYPDDRDRMWALLKEYGVSAYIAGHEHLYNRSVHDGVTQLIVGTSGSTIYRGAGGEFYHYVVAEVGDRGITMVVYDERGVERDRITLLLRPPA
jgi:3',5'-cyclic AMP phosphodiesterase CpdA